MHLLLFTMTHMRYFDVNWNFAQITNSKEIQPRWNNLRTCTTPENPYHSQRKYSQEALVWENTTENMPLHVYYCLQLQVKT